MFRSSGLRKLLFILLLIFVCNSISKAQLTINTTLTPAQLVQNVLVGNGVTISNIQFSGAPLQAAEFNGSATNMGLQSGILLSSGHASVAVGPNSSGSSTVPSGGIGGGGDADLTQLLGGTTTKDAAILEFDFLPMADTVSFRYVFGSEEYNEFVCSSFNDVFGFFISGPGINGPFLNNAANIALIPGTNTPVAINTVNIGQPGAGNSASDCPPGGLNNSQYFVNNASNSSSSSIQFDGFTKVLEAKSAVQCGQTYHIKLAIADGFDGTYDSGVFLEARSFSTNAPFQFQLNLPIATSDSLFYEGCGSMSVSFSMPDTLSQNITYPLVKTGTAMEGLDYVGIPDSISFSPGQTIFTININAIEDNEIESVETLNLQIFYKNSCNQEDTLIIPIKLADLYNVSIDAGPDVYLCEAEVINLTGNPSGNPLDIYNYLWSNGNTTSSSTYNIISDSLVTISLSDTCKDVIRNFYDSVFIKIIPPLNFQSYTIASGEPILLSVSVGTNYQWTPNIGLSCTDCQNPSANPDSSIIYIATRVEEHGCILTDSVVVNVLNTNFFVPNIFSPNNDQVNDFLKVYGVGIESVSMVIYNRWGEKVFETNDINQGWDGKIKGKEADSDTYLYFIKGQYFNKKEYAKEGKVVLIR